MRTKPTIYIAGPLFTIQERGFLENIRDWIYEAGAKPFLPHIDNKDNADNRSTEKASKERFTSIFKNDIDAIDKSDAIVALLDGIPCDIGTCIELGYAYARKKPILGIRTDFRTQGNQDFQVVDLMTQNICNKLCFEPLGNKEILKKEIVNFVKSLL